LILLAALLLRWPFPTSPWTHGDEWAFIVHPLGFWSGDFNPHFFNYPTLQLYLTSALYYLYYLLFSSEPLEEFVAYRYFIDDRDLLVLARASIAMMATGTVAVTMLLGRSLYGKRGGLLAGIVLALMPLHVRFSHLAITDIPATLWTTLAVFMAVRVVQEGSRVHYLLAGICTGLAAATKYPAALITVPVLAGALLRTPSLKNPGFWSIGIISLLTFALATPYTWLDAARFWTDFSTMAEDHLMGNQGREESAFIYLWCHTLRYGLGLVPLATVLIALLWKPKSWRRDEGVLVIAIISLIALLSVAESTFMRYALPLTPLLAVLMIRPILGGIGNRHLALVICMMGVLAEPGHASLQIRALLAGLDTRMQAQQWLGQYLPEGGRVVVVPGDRKELSIFNIGNLYTRQVRFSASFPQEQLLETYRLLSQRQDLPALHRYQTLDTIGKSALVQEIEGADTVLVVYYQHPLYRADIDSMLLDWIRESVHWQVEFSPGSLEGSIFDWQDAYFLPVGGWSHVEKTGPEIKIGYLPLAEIIPPLPRTRQLFSLLCQVMQAQEHIKKEDWTGAIERYGSVMQTPYYLPELLPASYIFQLFEELGHAYIGINDPQRAVHFWTLASSIRPERADLYYSIGLVYHDLGNYEEAIPYYQKAIEKNPRDSDSLYNLGVCYIRTGRYENSISVLRQSLELTPEVDAYINLGIAYGRMGRPEKRRECFRKVLEREPDHPQAASLRQALREFDSSSAER